MLDHLTPHPELYDVPYSTDAFRGMPYRRLGRSGLRASAIGLGTWKFGYPETGDGARVDERTAFAIMDRSLEVGVTFWDTANRYNNASGNAERLIGLWLAANPDQRRNVVLATKVFGGMDGATPNHSGLSRLNILESTYACLERLQCDYVDLLYFHTFETETPLEESLTAVEDLVRQDLVRYFGVSNVTVDRLRLHRALEKSMSVRTRVVAVQNGFNILQGEFNQRHEGVLEYCARHHVAFVPYSPLARGMLTDRYLDPATAGPGDRLVDEGLLDDYTSEESVATVQELHALATEWDMGLAQLALAYTLTLPGVGPVIPSCSTTEQVDSNASAGKVELAGEQRNRIAAALAHAPRDE